MTNFCDPFLRLSERACLSVPSLSTTPHVACRAESSRQSPAVLFHKGYSVLLPLMSLHQLIIGDSSCNSNYQYVILGTMATDHTPTFLYI